MAIKSQILDRETWRKGSEYRADDHQDTNRDRYGRRLASKPFDRILNRHTFIMTIGISSTEN